MTKYAELVKRLKDRTVKDDSKFEVQGSFNAQVTDQDCKEAAVAITELEAALKVARKAALEEAAVIAETKNWSKRRTIGDLIRALMDADATKAIPDGHIVVPAADYQTLVEHAKISENIIECETCGAWLTRDDEATASTEDYHGCWKVAAGEDDNGKNCRSYRALSAITTFPSAWL